MAISFDTETDTPDDGNELHGTPEQLAQDFFNKVKTELEAATTTIEVNAVHDNVLALFQKGEISEEQYDSFIIAYRKRFSQIERLTKNTELLHQTYSISDLNELINSIEAGGLHSPDELERLHTMSYERRAYLQGLYSDGLLRSIQTSYSIGSLEEVVSNINNAHEAGEVGDSHQEDLLRRIEERRAYLQGLYSDGLLRSIQTSYSIGSLKEVVSNINNAHEAGEVGDSHQEDLLARIEERRAYLAQIS